MINEISPPKPPKMTAELLSQNDFEQNILAQKANVQVSSKGLLRARAIIRDFEGIPRADLSPKQVKQLTEAYSQAGEFRKAHALSGDDVHLAIANATTKECDCPDFKTSELKNGRPVPVSYSRRFKVKDILRNGKNVPLLRCSECGHLSVKDGRSN